MTSTIHPDEITAETIGDQPEQQALSRHAADLEAENARLRAANTAMDQDQQQFLIHMGRRAREVAREHRWCEVAKALVTELGGVWPDDTFTFVVTSTRTVTATLAEGCDRDPEEVTAEFIADSLRFEDDMINLDEDWTNVEVFDDQRHTVGGIRRTSED